MDGLDQTSIPAVVYSKQKRSFGRISSTYTSQNKIRAPTCKTSVTSLQQQLQLESLEERRKIQRLAFMYKILNGQVAVPATSVDRTLSSRPSRCADANQQKLVTVRAHTENYRQSYSIRTVKDWNALPQSVVSAGSLALFKSRLSSHATP